MSFWLAHAAIFRVAFTNTGSFRTQRCGYDANVSQDVIWHNSPLLSHALQHILMLVPAVYLVLWG